MAALKYLKSKYYSFQKWLTEGATSVMALTRWREGAFIMQSHYSIYLSFKVTINPNRGHHQRNGVDKMVGGSIHYN